MRSAKPPLSDVEAVTRVHRSRAVRDGLLAAIKRGELKPGDPIPSERRLGETFGVSRVSVREALRSLEAMSLVEVHHGRGAFVASGPASRFAEPFASWLEVHRDAVIDLLKVRGALDELAAAEAAVEHDDDDLMRLRAAQSAFAEAAGREAASAEELTELDVAFHVEIARAAHSDLLLQLERDLHGELTESRAAMFTPKSRPTGSAAEHATIVDAIARRDAGQARAAVAAHIQTTRGLLEEEA
ncbi:MAG TPA: FCD domain-containing protein [Gaiellaceae bacterium]|nr:FCD domain-containing protein [Gaiellaceae bacterium]